MDVRRWWLAHLAAQRDCGEPQTVYCRARGLDPKYFSLWKRKLRRARSAEGPRLIPVVVKPAAAFSPTAGNTQAPTRPDGRLRMNLANGVPVCLEVSQHTLPILIRVLAELAC